MKRVDGKICISRYKEFKICKNYIILFIFGILIFNLLEISYVSASTNCNPTGYCSGSGPYNTCTDAYHCTNSCYNCYRAHVIAAGCRIKYAGPIVQCMIDGCEENYYDVNADWTDGCEHKGCNSDSECNDNNVCTTDACINPGQGASSYCANTPIISCSSGDGCCPSGCTYSGGDTDCPQGTPINTCAELQAMSVSGNYYLNKSITCGTFTPIGTCASQFIGTFDGRGYKIINLTIVSNLNCLGLFSNTSSSAKIKNVTLININITGGGTSSSVGGIVGHNLGSITNCQVLMNNSFKRQIKGYDKVGGLAGYNQGYILGCSANIIIINSTPSNYNLGGLVGLNEGIITSSSAKGNVFGRQNIGGLIGTASKMGLVENCYANALINNGTSYIGGLIGLNKGAISNSYATGNVTGSSGSSGIGGLAGYLFYDNELVYIKNCFATGNVSGSSNLGGLIGQKDGSAALPINSYFADISHDNGYGIAQSGGPNAFFTRTHPVYTGTPDWDFTNIWDNDGDSMLPYLRTDDYCGDGICENKAIENCYNCLDDCSCSGTKKCQREGVCLEPPIPSLSFIYPTKSNNEPTSNRFYEFEVSIDNPFPKDFKLNWNGTNYTLYNENLALMYNFDNREKLEENLGKVNDSSKYGNNGTVNGATWTSSGKYNGAYIFDGVNDYIDAGNKESLKPKKITISAWVKTNSAENNFFIAGFGGDTEAKQGYWIGMNSEGKAMSYIGVTSGYSWMVGSYINDNQWHYISLVYDANVAKIYVDGILSDNSNNLNADITYAGLGSLTIGKGDSLIPANYWNGLIDEIRIWNVSLSADEIKESYMYNLQKYNLTQWYLYVNQSNNATDALDFGNYSYQAFSSNTNDEYGKTDLRNISIIPIGVNQVFWGNMLGTMINNSDLRDRVKLSVGGTQLTNRVEYEIYKSVPLWWDKKVFSQTNESGFATWVADESGSYWFQARREGDNNWIKTTDNSDQDFRYLEVRGIENNFLPFVNITSPKTGDFYLSTELIDFNQSSYDEDDFFDFTWELDDNITKTGDSINYNNYKFRFNGYTSSGQKNIQLDVVDDRGARASNSRTIFVIDTSKILNYTFAYITKPNFGVAENGPLVKFNATKSFAIEVNSSRDITCIGGECPFTTTGGTLIYNRYGLRNNYNDMNFSWNFDDGDRYYVRGVNGTNFTKVFGTSGEHQAELEIIIPNAYSFTDTTFDITFINYCESDGLKYWNASGISFNTLISSVGCGGLNKVPGGDDDCCPANFGCTSTGCVLNKTLQTICGNISFCSDYKDSTNCSLDLCKVGSDSACGGIIQTGANCGDDFFIKINCSCKYNTASNKCELNSQIRGSVFQDNNAIIYYCNTTTNHGDCNTQNGLMRVQMNSTLTGVSGSCDLNESICSTEQGSVACGAARVRLPFFSFFNFVLSLILIGVIYTILVFKKKRN